MNWSFAGSKSTRLDFHLEKELRNIIAKMVRKVALCLMATLVCAMAVTELTTDNFDAEVANSNSVWVIEVWAIFTVEMCCVLTTSVWLLQIASKMCGSCKEMAPRFKQVAKNYKHAKFGLVYVDKKPGLQLAQSFKGVMEQGLPSVIVLKDATSATNYAAIVKGDPVSASQLKASIEKQVAGLSKDSNGVYTRQGNTEL
jgi:thioredoxin-like negative regulator of GroEL